MRYGIKPSRHERPDTEPVVQRLRELIAKHSNQKDCAKAIGIHCSTLTNILLKRRMPGPHVLKAIGLERRVVYVRTK